MPSKFRLERFEPVEIEKAQKVLDRHLKEAQEFQNRLETDQKQHKKKSFIQKLLAWFK
ncbi:hypothetical protein [Sulfurovum sp.]|jgi:hypothetical protein|uniref:hypothetical protein n=1 Tax=Sulfurovum sp. TaxID=1969726 RepID=UPI002A35AA06|nr:hypothetical protein [Sulfurovum sp.]MDY0403645.1 hypothetical protein [Sulfurovum sp.]